MASLDDLLGRRVYLDTSVFIYALNGFPEHAGFLTELFDAVDAGRVQTVTSEFTLGELLVIPFRRKDAAGEALCRKILHPRPGLELFPVTLDVLEGVARLRASSPSFLAPDALHLATAQLAGCDVFLTNDEHFLSAASPKVVLLSQVRPT